MLRWTLKEPAHSVVHGCSRVHTCRSRALQCTELALSALALVMHRTGCKRTVHSSPVRAQGSEGATVLPRAGTALGRLHLPCQLRLALLERIGR